MRGACSPRSRGRDGRVHAGGSEASGSARPVPAAAAAPPGGGGGGGGLALCPVPSPRRLAVCGGSVSPLMATGLSLVREAAGDGGVLPRRQFLSVLRGAGAWPGGSGWPPVGAGAFVRIQPPSRGVSGAGGGFPLSPLQIIPSGLPCPEAGAPHPAPLRCRAHRCSPRWKSS